MAYLSHFYQIRKAPGFFNEWIDSFYARDIQELFGFRNRRGFLALFRLLLRQSGGLLNYTQMANSIESITRPTVISHVAAMQIAHAVHLLPPFHGGGKREIVSRPKCYAFDTGFVTFEKGWSSIRDDDRGILWEHLALDSLRFRYADDDIFYWQDKSHREIDFVVRKGSDRVDTFSFLHWKTLQTPEFPQKFLDIPRTAPWLVYSLMGMLERFTS